MSNIISTDGCFSEQQKQALTLLFDMMIPADDPMPSAADPEIAPRTLAGLGAYEATVAEALTALTEQSLEQLDAAQRGAVVEALKATHPDFIALLQAQVIASYYQDDRVLLALGLPARSPHPGGYEVAATDWSLLDPVRTRTPFYRQTGDGDV